MHACMYDRSSPGSSRNARYSQGQKREPRSTYLHVRQPVRTLGVLARRRWPALTCVMIRRVSGLLQLQGPMEGNSACASEAGTSSDWWSRAGRDGVDGPKREGLRGDRDSLLAEMQGPYEMGTGLLAGASGVLGGGGGGGRGARLRRTRLGGYLCSDIKNESRSKY